jgi:hypothetical protein
VAKISVSLKDDPYERTRDAADARLRSDILRAVSNEIAEETGGPFTEAELREAAAAFTSPKT